MKLNGLQEVIHRALMHACVCTHTRFPFKTTMAGDGEQFFQVYFEYFFRVVFKKINR